MVLIITRVKNWFIVGNEEIGGIYLFGLEEKNKAKGIYEVTFALKEVFMGIDWPMEIEEGGPRASKNLL